MSRLVQLAGEALRGGVDPASPAAEGVLAGLLGDTDRAAMLQRVTSAAHADPARFRELASLVRGVEPLSAPRRSSRGWSPHSGLARPVNLTCVSRTVGRTARNGQGTKKGRIGGGHRGSAQGVPADRRGRGRVHHRRGVQDRLAQEGDWNVTESVAEVIIRTRDLNGDKLLSFDEFWAHLNK